MNIRSKKIIKFHLEYRSLFKIEPRERSENQMIKDFQAKLKITMPFWPRNVEKKMIENNKNKSQKEKEAVEEDILFLGSMKTDRTAQYTTRDTVTERLQKNEIV